MQGWHHASSCELTAQPLNRPLSRRRPRLTAETTVQIQDFMMATLSRSDLVKKKGPFRSSVMGTTCLKANVSNLIQADGNPRVTF